ncbi:Chloroperoxidase [Zopfochytrium polystomum]|nr:Chloroperoxidase [Zopfochytrium polystomum]
MPSYQPAGGQRRRRRGWAASSVVAVLAALAIAFAAVGPAAAAREPWVAPRKNELRSPCPMLNALANHGYINRQGNNVPLGDVIRVLESDDVGYPSVLAFMHSMSTAVWIKFNSDSNALLTSFDVLDHDASLTRQDFALVKHRRVDKDLVAQLASFAGDKGYLTYEDLARARQLRYAQSKAANPNFRFSLLGRFYAMLESVSLMEVIGTDGKLSVDIMQDFFLHERLPLKWKPHKWDVGFYGISLYRRLVIFTFQTYFVDIMSPVKKAPAKEPHEKDEF